MKYQIKYFLVFMGVFALYLTTGCDSCSKNENCPSRLVYKIPFSLTPPKDTFKIGFDTIWVEASFDGTLVDTNGVSNTFEGCDFMIELGVEKIDTDPTTGKTIEDFPVVTKKGDVIPRVLSNLGLSYYEIKTVFEDGKYRFKAGLIPQKQGLYVVAIAPIIYKDLECPLTGNCKKTAYVVYSGLNIGGKNNFSFLKNSPAPHILSTKKHDFENGGGYALYVK